MKIGLKRDHPEYMKEYAKRNCEDLRKYHQEYRAKNKEKLSARRKERYLKNKETEKRTMKIYYLNNRGKIVKRQAVEVADRRKKDLNFRVKENLRSRIGHFFRGKNKPKRTMELIGCSVEDFIVHIESQFREGMSWENYGFDTWHIDHIKPCASFDLTNPDQQKECFSYKNLQPLWAKENFSKGGRV